VRITAVNRGPDAAELHLLPTLWFRNDWAEWITEANRLPKSRISGRSRRRRERAPSWLRIGCWASSFCSCEGDAPLYFTENSTNNDRLFPGRPNAAPFVKDGINDCVVQGNTMP
jgi:hypothetical protein